MLSHIFQKAAFILFIILCGNLSAQSPSDLSFAYTLCNTPPPSHQIVVTPFNYKSNKTAYILRTPYLFYKYFVSSNDVSSCSFYPSCANFGMESTQHWGLMGVLYSFDRVSRCHNLDHKHYLWHIPSGKLFDSPQGNTLMSLR